MRENVNRILGDMEEQGQYLLFMFIIKNCENVEKDEERENSVGVIVVGSEF